MTLGFVTGGGTGLPLRLVGPGKSGSHVIARLNVISERDFGCLWWEEALNFVVAWEIAGVSSAKTSLYV